MNAVDADRLQWSKGNLERVQACPACGSHERLGGPLVCADHVTYLIDEPWTVHRCACCHSVSLDPRPDSVSLPRAYESYYTHAADEKPSATSGLGGMMWRAIQGYLNRRFGMVRHPAATWGYWLFLLLPPLRLKLDYYGRHLFADRYPARGRLLDVGCGNGSFLARAHDMGWRTVGIDPDPAAVAFCRSHGLDVVEGNLAQSPSDWSSSFDIVTLRHCIEHVQRPDEYLRKARDLLKPGGEIWVAWPNTRSLGFAFFREAWAELHAPHHLCIPSPEQLEAMLKRTGFRDVRFKRRGIHAKASTRKSIENTKETGKIDSKRLILAYLVCIFIDIASSLFYKSGIEVVLTAKN